MLSLNLNLNNDNTVLKAVLSTFGFHFIYSLTLIHTLTTLAGMKAFQAAGELKRERERESFVAKFISFFSSFLLAHHHHHHHHHYHPPQKNK